MEVHAHTHTSLDPNSHRGRKKWTHYLWEFLMLFLAVFCGFLAENLREHQIEKQREKQFMHSLINDIMADTARLNTIIRTRNQREIWLDSLSFIMNSKNIRSYPTINIYYYAVYVPRSVSLHFLPNDGTLQQLKNSGSLRLIHNVGIVDSITHYDVQTKNLIKTGEVEEELFQDYRTIVYKFFDGVAFDAMLDAENQPHRITFNPELYSFSAEDLHQFNYKLFSIQAYNRAIRRESKQLLEQAKNLLTLLKKAYHL